MDHQEWLEQHDRMLADHDQMMARIDRRLDRAIRLSVQDERRQRKRNLDFDEKMTQLASAQLANEQLLKAFLERGGNGKH